MLVQQPINAKNSLQSHQKRTFQLHMYRTTLHRMVYAYLQQRTTYSTVSKCTLTEPAVITSATRQHTVIVVHFIQVR